MTAMSNLFRTFGRRRRAEEDFADEIESHIALEAERLAAEGWDAAEANDEARRRFGNRGAAKEQYHESRVWPLIEGLIQDVRYALRALKRTPVFTTVAILSLALGIGANTAVFSFVNAALFRPLPVAHPERIVSVSPDPGLFTTIDYPTVVSFRAYPRLFDAVAAVRPIERANITIDGNPVGRATVHLVTGDYFSVFDVRASVGRVITMEDERAPGQHPVVVISESYWRSAFGGVLDVVGKSLTLNGVNYAVVGVAPARFTGDEIGLPADLWIPLMMQGAVMPEQSRGLMTSVRFYRMLARLKPSVSIEQATREATAVYRQIAREPRSDAPALSEEELAKLQVMIVSNRRGRTPAIDDKGSQMVVLWAIVALVLAIAYVNVAGLLLVRAAAREREFSTRLALGAGVGRIARLLLAEGAVIGVAASLLGVGLAVLGARWLAYAAASGTQPLRLNLSADARVLGLTIAASLMAILVCGLAPAVRLRQLSLAAGLKASRLGRAGRGPSWFGRGLVVAQVALAVTLVVAAGLFTRTLSALQEQDTGFEPQRLLEAAAVPEQANIGGERLAALFDAVIERMRAMPGVEDAAVATHGLLSGTGTGAVNTTVVGYVRPPEELPFVPYNYVTPTYFHTAGIRLLAGRMLEAGDAAGRPLVVVVSASMARHFFGSASAVGQHLYFSSNPNALVEIVGVVHDTKDRSLRDAEGMLLYLPYRQDLRRLRGMSVVVRTKGDPAELTPLLRRTLRELEPTLPLTSVAPMRTQMLSTITMDWFTAVATTFFGVVSLLLAAIGMFAVAAQAVNARTSEIGIRMALGGTRGSVMRLIVGDNMLLVVIALGLGNGLAYVAARAIQARLFGVAPGDPTSFAAATTIMIGAALVAALPPARRAARTDPAISLRHE
jgi:predicted permease